MFMPSSPRTPSASSRAGTGRTTVSTPTRQYFSRRSSSTAIPVLPVDVDFVGIWSPFALLWGIIFLMVPFAYITILAVIVRELCWFFPEQIYTPIQHSLPFLADRITRFQENRSLVVEIWCVIEAMFYIYLKLRIKWLQTRDPLEASLSAAPLMELEDRAVLWERMMESETGDPVAFLSGWFFDAPIEQISKYDIRDFVAWSMFEGRHQEHLTTAELEQLESFVEAAEIRISLHLYGEAKEEVTEAIENVVSVPPTTERATVKRPQKYFHFPLETHHGEPSFFSDLFESYRASYEQMLTADFHPVQDLRDMVKKADFKPVQDFRNLMAETAQQLAGAEETAVATANQMYETLVPSGSQMGKQLSAMSHATFMQLTEAWNSVRNIKERLETARFLSKQRQSIRQQLKGYRVMLNRMREMSSAVPSKQMAVLMRRITECNEAMERLESRAQSAFVQATGFARKNLPFLKREPSRFAKYSSDPLLGLATYPLGFHLLVLGATEIPLRVMMRRRGFERLSVGPVAYYFHPGSESLLDDNEDDDGSIGTDSTTPVVFVHGIGIGLIVYMPLIDALLKSGRPILLPEIPYVSGFRPWQSPNAVLQPAVVASTMTAMLATHGFLRATWLGHSYGSTWLSYMCKYASEAVAAVLFLDPICFCLHVPRLTKQFVYMRPDPGTISYIVRTDVVVNWTIQRSFPWAWIVLFTEQIKVPCAVFLSDKDALVPAEKVEEYLKSKGAHVRDFESLSVEDELPESTISCTVFRGDGHGDWTERPAATIPVIAATAEALCRKAEA